MDIQKAIEDFTQHLVSVNRSPATVTAYKQDLFQLSESLGDIDVTKVTTKQLQEFISQMSTKGYSNKSISRKLNSIKSMFRYLHDKEVILVDPSKPIPHPALDPKLPRVLSELEYRSLRDVAKGNIRLYTLIEIMLQTGLRIG